MRLSKIINHIKLINLNVKPNKSEEFSTALVFNTVILIKFCPPHPKNNNIDGEKNPSFIINIHKTEENHGSASNE